MTNRVEINVYGNTSNPYYDEVVTLAENYETAINNGAIDVETYRDRATHGYEINGIVSDDGLYAEISRDPNHELLRHQISGLPDAGT